jgi:hypothetical protein
MKKTKRSGLFSFSDMTAEERAQITSKGGKASGLVRQQKKTYREIADALLRMKPTAELLKKFKGISPNMKNVPTDLKVLMVLGQIGRAIKGDTKAFEAVRDISEIDDKQREGTIANSFYACCEVCGYPPPYMKQVEMADFVFDVLPEPRLLLGARRYGKSEYAVIIKAAQEIVLHNRRILLIVKDQERAKDFGAEIGRCVKAIGGEGGLIKDSSTVLQLASNESKEPNLCVLVMGSKGLRSRHPDIVIMDDPITPQSASPADRKQAKRVYDEVLKLTQAVRIIGQPVCRDDLYDVIRNRIKTLEVPYGAIPQLDTDLEILRLAGVDDASINASYFLKVTDISNTPFRNIQDTDILFNDKGAIASIDPSHEGGDYTAISIMQGIPDGRIIVIGFCFKAAWYDCLDELLKVVKQYKVKRLFFENNALGDEPIRQIKNICTNNNIACLTSGFKSLDNKEAKIQNAGMFANLLLLSSQSNEIYKEQLKKYEIGADYDDAPDSLANLLINAGIMKSAKEKRGIL